MHLSTNLFVIVAVFTPVIVCLPDTETNLEVRELFDTNMFNDDGFDERGVEDDQEIDEEFESLLKKHMSKGFARQSEDAAGHTDNRNDFLDWLLGIIGITTTTTQKPPSGPPTECKPCLCGKTNTKHRIVGGHETEVLQYPWMAALLHNNQFFCGGTLINNEYILTAAHCVTRLKPEKLKIRLLEHDRSKEDETTTITATVRRIIQHPRYNPNTYNNDIALIQMSEPVEIKGDLRPACMPTRGRSFTGYNATALGWGTTEEGGSASNVLQEVVVPIISNPDCRKTKYGEDKVTDNMLCAGYPEGQEDACQGDSGGGLIVSNSTTDLYQVVGIVSWGQGCAQPDYPGVYTRVNRYLTWLKDNTPDACYCESSAQYNVLI